MLLKPFLAKCSDRNVLPKVHPGSGSPDDWFANDILIPNGLFGISFDFFVNWSSYPNSLSPIIWIKRVLSPDYKYRNIIKNLNNVIIDEFGADYLLRLIAFASKFKLAVQLIIFRDDFDWSDKANTVIVVDVNSDAQGSLHFSHNEITITQFKLIIQANSGGPVSIGHKGLIFGTSNLECALSQTDSLYPGDIDLLLLNDANEPVAIIEYKKHTLSSSINDQNLSKYYPKPDGRKYDRLAILRDFLNANNISLPVIIIYYPIEEGFKQGRMELVKGPVGKLSSFAASNFKLPANNLSEQKLPVILKTLKAIHYYSRSH